MDAKTRNELRFLRLYMIVSTAALAVVAFGAFRQAPGTARFKEISVERLNIIEKDGRTRMVLANGDLSPAPLMHGRRLSFGSMGGRPGIIFYNDEGTETGGLGFGGRKQNGKVAAFGGLTFDQYDQDQVVALEYEEENGQRTQGLTVLERPDVGLDSMLERQAAIQRMPDGPEKKRALEAMQAMGGGRPWGAPRLFVGRSRNKAAVVSLADARGRVRLRLSVDSAGVGRLLFLDAAGHVVYALPDSGQVAGARM